MTRRVFLDANVLVPYDLTCLFLALAQQEVCEVRWSDAVLEEVRRALIVKLGLAPDRADRRLQAMQAGFPEASVAPDVEDRTRDLGCDPKDRHVLDAAISGAATHLVTANLRDFDAEVAETFGVCVEHPDDFFMELFTENQIGMRRSIAVELAHRCEGSGSAAQLLKSLAGLLPRTVGHLQDDVAPLDSLAGWYREPETPFAPDDALQNVADWVRGRADEGVEMARGFLDPRLTAKGEFTIRWEGLSTVNGPLLLELSPFENLAEFVSVPLSFNNEEGRRIRQHVSSVTVLGDSEWMGTVTSQEAYARGTGLPLSWLPGA